MSGNCPPLLSRHACSQLMSVGSQHRLWQAQCHFHLRLSWQLGSSWTDVLPLCTPTLKHVDVSDIFLSGNDQRGISCFSVGSACRPSCTDMPRNKSCKPSLLTAVRTISSSSPVDLTERDPKTQRPVKNSHALRAKSLTSKDSRCPYGDLGSAMASVIKYHQIKLI